MPTGKALIKIICGSLNDLVVDEKSGCGSVGAQQAIANLEAAIKYPSDPLPEGTEPGSR